MFVVVHLKTVQSLEQKLICVHPQLYHKGADDGSDEEWVRLTRLYQFARNLRALLHTYHYNQIFLSDFHGAYNKFTGSCLEPRFYGYMSTDDLLNAIPQVTFPFDTCNPGELWCHVMVAVLKPNPWFCDVRWSGSKDMVAKGLLF